MHKSISVSSIRNAKIDFYTVLESKEVLSYVNILREKPNSGDITKFVRSHQQIVIPNLKWNNLCKFENMVGGIR